MKFRKVMTSIGTLGKQDFYNFTFTKEQLEEARKRTFDNPLLIHEQGSILMLYNDDGELRLDYFISSYGFREGFGNHEPKEYSNLVICSCGKKFPQGKNKNGMKNFNKHLYEINKMKEEESEIKKEEK